VVAEDGNTYEMQYIQKWLAEESRSPLTGATLNKPVPWPLQKVDNDRFCLSGSQGNNYAYLLRCFPKY